MTAVLIFTIMSGCAVLSSIVAANKNRSVLGWALIGFFFTLFGFLAALVVSEVEEEGETSNSSNTQPSATREFKPDEHEKKCPACAEYIKLEARVCRYCGQEFSAEEVERQIEERKEKVKQKKESEQASNSVEGILATHDFSGGSTCSKCGVSKSYAKNNKYECPSQ